MNPLVNWNFNKNISPYATAIVAGGNSFTYLQLADTINKRATSFFNQKVLAKDLVAFIFDNNADFIINIFALWKLGAVPVPINLRLTDEEIKNLISFAECKFILADESVNKIITFNDKQNLDYSKNFIPPDAHKETVPRVSDTALIIFTSGSSGKPKGVELSFFNLIKNYEAGNQFIGHKTQDIWLASLPFFHIGGFSILIRTFLAGASVIIPDSLSTDDLMLSMKRYKPTLASLVSTQLVRFLERRYSPGKELRNVLLGGGFIDEELILKAMDYGWNVSKVYGSTETASFITALDCTKKIKLNSAGKALEPNNVFIVDEKWNKLSANKEGEIAVQGNSNAKGYLNNPEASMKRFSNQIYYTGDIGHLDEEGYLFISAKRTDLIVTGGENVNPHEVEREILHHPDIVEAAVFGIEDKEWGHSVAAAIITNNQTQITVNQLRDFLRDKVAAYKIPRRLFIVDELPKSSLGKIQRDELTRMISGLQA